MKNVIKKITATALCGVLAAGSAFAVSAAPKSVEKSQERFEVTGETQQINNNQLFVTTTGYTSKTSRLYGVLFKDEQENEFKLMFKSCEKYPKYIQLPKGKKFSRFMANEYNYGFGNSFACHTFDTTGGKYVKVKVKLSDFNGYFNSDGTFTAPLNNGVLRTYDYNYHDYGKDNRGMLLYESSGAYAHSGGAITSFVPDKNGYAEIYVSRNIGDDVELMITCESVLKNGVLGDEGVTSALLSNFICGNTDDDWMVSVSDATAIQKYVVNENKLSKLQLFNGDVNSDGAVNVVDATLIQKYIVSDKS